MHFIILGAGSIGCYVGGRLRAAGQAVTLVGRPRVTGPLAQDGLLVTDLEGFRAHLPPGLLRFAPDLATAWVAQAAPATNAGQTVVLLCVKGGATVSAAQEIAACCPPGTPVVSLQNGVENPARIASAAPLVLALAGMVPYNVVMRSAHHVHRATAGNLYLAHSPITEQMLPLLVAAGLPAVLDHHMLAVQWSKLLLNLNNPVNALSNLPLREQLMDRGYRRVLAALQMEALAAMTVAGIEPTRVGAVAPRLLPYLLRLPNWLFTRVAARMLRIDATARSSMWDDLQRGRSTEIDDFCGAVVRLAAQHRRPAPLNATMCRLVAAYPQGQSWTGASLLKALHSPPPDQSG